MNELFYIKIQERDVLQYQGKFRKLFFLKIHPVCFSRSSELAQEQSLRSNPVVEYCRLWRWPDLSNPNELKPVDFCPNAFHYGLDNICINPHHYDRVPSMYQYHRLLK